MSGRNLYEETKTAAVPSTQQYGIWAREYQAVTGSAKYTCCMLRSKVTAKAMMQTERTAQIPCTFDCGLAFTCGMVRDLFTVASVSPVSMLDDTAPSRAEIRVQG